MPSKQQVAIEKIRGVNLKTNKLFNNSLSDLDNQLTVVSKLIETLNTKQTNFINSKLSIANAQSSQFNRRLSSQMAVNNAELAASMEVITASMSDIIKNVHPDMSVLAALDNDNETYILETSEVYGLLYLTFDTYDDHNDDSVDLSLWTITTATGGDGSQTATVTEESTEFMHCYAYASYSSGSYPWALAHANSDNVYTRWHAKAKATVAGSSTRNTQIYIIGNTNHFFNITQDNTYRDYLIYKEGNNIVVTQNGTVILSEADTNSTFAIRPYAYAKKTGAGGSATAHLYIDKTGRTGTDYGIGSNTGNILSDAISANTNLLSFYSHITGNFSNGQSSHALPIGIEIYGDVDSYATALNATTKFKITPSTPSIYFYRTDISEVAKGAGQTTWIMDDNVTNGALPAKTTSTHETILAEEVGVQSIIMVEQSINGTFSDVEILIEGNNYEIDYADRNATEIILSDGSNITTSSKLRITWIADIIDVDAGSQIAALKTKIYLTRTSYGETSPTISKISLGTNKYINMKYLT